jgi:hypothetical protein
MGEAEGRKCHDKFFHVYGESAHNCPQEGCDGTLRCGMQQCEDRHKPTPAFTTQVTAGQMDELLSRDDAPLEISRMGTPIDECQIGDTVEVTCTEDDRRDCATITGKVAELSPWWRLTLDVTST